MKICSTILGTNRRQETKAGRRISDHVNQSASERRLKAELDALAKPVKGIVGYSLYHTRQNHRIALNGDEIFPTASTIKVAVMGKAFEEVTSGRLGYLDKLAIAPDDRRGGAGFLQFYKDDAKPEIKELIHLMITVSDNTATIMLAKKLGVVAINEWLSRLNLKDTRLLSAIPPEEKELLALREKWGMGMATPNEMVALLDAIRTNKAGTVAACEAMIRILTHQYFDDLIAAQSPPWVPVASKSGSIDASRSDIAIVFSPSGPYILAVYAKEIEDRRWSKENESQKMIKAIARKVYQHYHPREKWSPPPGHDAL